MTFLLVLAALNMVCGRGGISAITAFIMVFVGTVSEAPW